MSLQYFSFTVSLITREEKMKKLPYKFTPEEIIDQGRTTQENIDVIREWLNCTHDEALPRYVQDELIVIFLLSCENNIPLTKNTIIKYYRCKKNGPEIFDGWDMDREELKNAMNTIRMSSIPVRTDENYVVHFFKLHDGNYKNFDLVSLMQLSYMLMDVTQEKHLPRGLIVVIDIKEVGLMHLTKFKMGALKKYLEFLQEGFPMQMKVIHIINAVYFFDKIMNIIKVFLKGEIMNMIQVHPPTTNLEKLFSLVPKKCWPNDYGGDLPPCDVLHQKTVQQFRDKQSFWALEHEIRHEE